MSELEGNDPEYRFWNTPPRRRALTRDVRDEDVLAEVEVGLVEDLPSIRPVTPAV